MKVLAKGRIQQGWSIETTCTGAGNGGGGCGAKLLVEQPDIHLTQSHSYDGSSDEYATFECSACGVRTDLPQTKVPGHVWRSMQPFPMKEDE